MITFYSSFLAVILWKSSGIHVKDIICSNDFLEVALYLETALQINVSHSYIICVLLNLHDCRNYWNATVWMALLYRNWVRAYKLFLFHAWKVHSQLFPWRKKLQINLIINIISMHFMGSSLGPMLLVQEHWTQSFPHFMWQYMLINWGSLPKVLKHIKW